VACDGASGAKADRTPGPARLQIGTCPCAGDQVADPIASFTANGAYDQGAVYREVAARHPAAEVIVPPRSSTVPSATA
jgi:hypothetical protein